MLVVADANIFVSALVSRGYTLDLFFSDKLEILVPEFVFSEMGEHKNEILGKSGISEEEFELFINLLITRVDIVSSEEFTELLEEAKRISPDPDDTQYFALALKHNCAIWSNDSDLKEQTKVKIFTTEELIKSFE